MADRFNMSKLTPYQINNVLRAILFDMVGVSVFSLHLAKLVPFLYTLAKSREVLIQDNAKMIYRLENRE